MRLPKFLMQQARSQLSPVTSAPAVAVLTSARRAEASGATGCNLDIIENLNQSCGGAPIPTAMTTGVNSVLLTTHAYTRPLAIFPPTPSEWRAAYKDRPTAWDDDDAQ